MTGGQHVDGPLDPAKITHQLHREGVSPVWLVSEFPERYQASQLAPGTEIHHRDEVEAAMLAHRECRGVSPSSTTRPARRRSDAAASAAFSRSRPAIAINPRLRGLRRLLVQSNCLSVEPLETDWGPQAPRQPSTCNKDTSLPQGLLPSFVTLEGAKPRTRAARAAPDLSGVPSRCRPRSPSPATSPSPASAARASHHRRRARHGGPISTATRRCCSTWPARPEGRAVLSHVRIGRRAEDVTCPRHRLGRGRRP